MRFKSNLLKFLCFTILISTQASVEVVKTIYRGSSTTTPTTITGFGKCDAITASTDDVGTAITDNNNRCKCSSQKQIFYMDKMHTTITCYGNNDMKSITSCTNVFVTMKDTKYKVNRNPTCVIESASVWDFAPDAQNQIIGIWNQNFNSQLLPALNKALQNTDVDVTLFNFDGLLIRVNYTKPCADKCDLIYYLGTKTYPLKGTDIFLKTTNAPSTSLSLSSSSSPFPPSLSSPSSSSSSSSSSSPSSSPSSSSSSSSSLSPPSSSSSSSSSPSSSSSSSSSPLWSSSPSSSSSLLSSSWSSSSSTRIIIGVVIAAIIIIMLVFASVYIWTKRKKRSNTSLPRKTKKVEPPIYVEYDATASTKTSQAEVQLQLQQEQQEEHYNYTYNNSAFQKEVNKIKRSYNEETHDEDNYHSDDSTDENFYYDPATVNEDLEDKCLPEYAIVNKRKT